MSYTTPPSLNPTLKQDIEALRAVVKTNAVAIAGSMISRALRNAGIPSIPKISTPPLVKVIDNIIIPFAHHWEGTWGDHPNDSGGPTMRGVILITLVGSFDSILINTGIPAVANAAIAFNRKYPTWKTDNQLGKQVLYVLLTDTKVAGLWVYNFLSNSYCRYPLAVMTEDPFLGWFISQSVWASGYGTFTAEGANYDKIFREMGWNGRDASFPSWCISLGDKTPELSTKLLARRVQFTLDISQPGMKNNVFRKGWLNSIVLDKKYSIVSALVRLNENFYLNSKGEYSLSQAELEHLKRKAEIYKSFKIQIPG